MMAGRYHLHISPDALVLALDDDGGTSITDYAETHGTEAACQLFEDWLRERIAERQRAAEAVARRDGFRLIGEGRPCC